MSGRPDIERWREKARDVHFDLNGFERSFVEQHGNKNCRRCDVIAAALAEAAQEGRPHCRVSPHEELDDSGLCNFRADQLAAAANRERREGFRRGVEAAAKVADRFEAGRRPDAKWKDPILEAALNKEDRWKLLIEGGRLAAQGIAKGIRALAPPAENK